MRRDDVLFSATFARIIAILMRSPHYKHYTLSDLEWLVLPPMMTGQFEVLEVAVPGAPIPVPVAVALWAQVSVEVDHRLSTNPAVGMKLRPDEWRSGDIWWLIDAIGPSQVLPQLLTGLTANVFKGRNVKVRTFEQEGRATVLQKVEVSAS
jgi:hemolysin-activating ACP:hemolysin acyltransferase